LAEKVEPEYIEKTHIPAVGAYLGCVIERQFEGYWIPRRDIFETQPVVGQIALLRFVRARNYLQSKNSALEFSLKKVYQVFEDHIEHT